MTIIVQKFGGSSVADNTKLYRVCQHIIRECKKTNKVLVVVSAQGKTTNLLLNQAYTIDKKPSSRELDVLLSSGEQITAAKLAIYLNYLGYRASSLLGWQIPIKTNNEFNNADIIKINVTRIFDYFSEKDILVVAGFQGINENGEITTLGRGGSDTTAVALAAALKAKRCEIYTDVDGVYTEDPKKNKKARKIDFITYDKMLEMANHGAKVLHSKCIEIGEEFKVPIYVKSTFKENSVGTYVGNREEKTVDK